MKNLTDKQLRELSRDTERKASGTSWLMELVVWVGTAGLFFFLVMWYLERHGMLCGTPNP